MDVFSLKFPVQDVHHFIWGSLLNNTIPSHLTNSTKNDPIQKKIKTASNFSNYFVVVRHKLQKMISNIPTFFIYFAVYELDSNNLVVN